MRLYRSKYMPVLVETTIRYIFPELDQSQLEGAVRNAVLAMRDTRTELHDHVSLQEVLRMPDKQMLFRIKALRSMTTREFSYEYESGRLFACSSMVAYPDAQHYRCKKPLLNGGKSQKGFS